MKTAFDIYMAIRNLYFLRDHVAQPELDYLRDRGAALLTKEKFHAQWKAAYGRYTRAETAISRLGNRLRGIEIE